MVEKYIGDVQPKDVAKEFYLIATLLEAEGKAISGCGDASSLESGLEAAFRPVVQFVVRKIAVEKMGQAVYYMKLANRFIEMARA